MVGERILHLWVFAQQAAAGMTLDTVINVATGAGFGALAWYLIVVVLPKKDEEHRKERQADQERWKAERAEYLEYIKKRDDKLDEMNEKFTDTMIRVEAFLVENKNGSSK